MVDLVRLFSTEGKGSKSMYRPDAGTVCLLSGPNCDDESGYVFLEMEILWRDDLFVVYRTPGCWPNVHKWEHVIAKPIPTPVACAEDIGFGMKCRRERGHAGPHAQNPKVLFGEEPVL